MCLPITLALARYALSTSPLEAGELVVVASELRRRKWTDDRRGRIELQRQCICRRMRKPFGLRQADADDGQRQDDADRRDAQPEDDLLAQTRSARTGGPARWPAPLEIGTL